MGVIGPGPDGVGSYGYTISHDDNLENVRDAKEGLMSAHLETMKKFTDPEKAKYQMLFEDKYYIIHKDDFQRVFKNLLSKI